MVDKYCDCSVSTKEGLDKWVDGTVGFVVEVGVGLEGGTALVGRVEVDSKVGVGSLVRIEDNWVSVEVVVVDIEEVRV